MYSKTRKTPLLSKRLVILFSFVVALLLLPLIAMQFSSDVDWKLFDFLIAAVLLSGTVLLCELVLWKVKKTSTRIAICATILFLLFLVWTELAVGIFGTPFAGS